MGLIKLRSRQLILKNILTKESCQAGRCFLKRKEPLIFSDNRVAAFDGRGSPEMNYLGADKVPALRFGKTLVHSVAPFNFLAIHKIIFVKAANF